MKGVNSKPNYFIVCCGVGHINRGYESFTMECFDTLKDHHAFNLILLKGKGRKTRNELNIFCLKRNSKIAEIISKVFSKEGYWIEQFTFFLGMLPYIIIKRPVVIYYSDFILGTFLWHFRKFLNFKYKLLFSNGAPNGPPYKTEDHVQQLLPYYLKQGINAGIENSKQTLLPYAIKIDITLNLKLLDARIEILKMLKLPMNKKYIICIGAINSHHKRIDYLIEEFANMPNQEYFLIVLGQIDKLSIPILQLAKEKLCNDNYLIKQVSSNEILNYLSIADYFILPSLNEGLPRVLPEAMGAGLLPIVHDYNITRETLKEYGVYRNLNNKNILESCIKEVDERNISKVEIINYAHKNYSWDVLKDEYVRMLVNQY